MFITLMGFDYKHKQVDGALKASKQRRVYEATQ